MRWPYASPGWLGAYAAGVATWLAIAAIFGPAVVVGLIALLGVVAGEWMHRQ